MRAARLRNSPAAPQFIFVVIDNRVCRFVQKKVQKRSVEDPCFLERVVGTVLGNSAQGFAGKLHADVTATATVKLRHPNALLLEVGIHGTINSLGNVTTDTALFLGKTGAMNAAALVRHSKRDIADSGHKIFVRLKVKRSAILHEFSPASSKTS